MFQHSLISKFGTSATVITICIGMLSSAAQALVKSCNYKDTIFNGEVDFGSGNHSFSDPVGQGTIRWNFASINNAIVVTARVRGTLYLDKLGASCGRLKINFQDIASNNIQTTQSIRLCGPGFDANSRENQRAIDVTSLPNARLRRVQLTLGQGQTLQTIVDLHDGSSFAPSTNLTIQDRINNGSADFGGNSHSGGEPSSDASVRLNLLNNGNVAGEVRGILYWDDLSSGGHTRIVTDFQNSNGTTLQSRTDEVDGNGGDAEDVENKVLVQRLFQSASLSQIRLTVGRVSNGNFVNVVSRSYSFKCGS